MLLKTQFASDLLDVEAEGEFSLDEAKRNFLEVLDAIVRYRAEKVLIDGRRLKGEPEVMERFFYGEFVANETARRTGGGRMPRVPRFAYVLVEPVLDPNRFGETVASNRGMIIKVFDNREEALQWLEVDSAGKLDQGNS
jgi:hypothetical protein